MTTLTIKDESTVGKTLRVTRIELPEEQVTVEELLRSYVFQRVKDANVQRADAPSTAYLVDPEQDEILLNGTKPATPTPIDWHSEFDKAKQAFRSHQILVFIDDQQLDSLDAVVSLGASTDVRFLRLTMLVGG